MSYGRFDRERSIAFLSLPHMHAVPENAIVRAMVFANPSPEQICQMLRSIHTIAVVGLSPNPQRPSFRVARAMQGYGFRIVPVRPRHGGAQPSGTGVAASHLLPQRKGGSEAAGNPLVQEVLGEQAYPDLESLPFKVDMVDVFRAPQHVPAIVESCIALGIPRLWLQEGVIHEEAVQRAQVAGITVVMNRCMWRDYSQLCGQAK